MSVTEAIAVKMMNLVHLRNTKRSWIIYAVGLFIGGSVCLAFKNFNDKMTLMGDSVVRYQHMIDKQSEQLTDVTKEKERYKRDLKHAKEMHTGSMKEMEERFNNLQDDCKHEASRLEGELSDIQDSHQTLIEDHRKLESKYKTLTKANNAAITDVENFKQENKKLRAQLHDATSSKSSELYELRDKIEKLTQERDHYQDQYEALFKQHQQSYDSIQLLQTERDKLQDQIREIQKLSGGHSPGQSSSAPGQAQLQPDSMSSSSTAKALSPVNQVVEEPAAVPGVSSSTSSSVQGLAGGQGAVAPPLDDQDVQSAIDAAAALVRYPPSINKGARQQQRQRVVPLQPYQHQQEDDYDVQDVLNAPAQQYFDQDAQDWYQQQQQQQQRVKQQSYGGARQQYGVNVQQIVPQVGKYQQQQQGQIVRHGDHYHVQQHPEQQQRPRQEQRWYPGLDNNQIQDFYRGHGSRDF